MVFVEELLDLVELADMNMTLRVVVPSWSLTVG